MGGEGFRYESRYSRGEYVMYNENVNCYNVFLRDAIKARLGIAIDNEKEAKYKHIPDYEEQTGQKFLSGKTKIIYLWVVKSFLDPFDISAPFFFSSREAFIKAHGGSHAKDEQLVPVEVPAEYVPDDFIPDNF